MRLATLIISMFLMLAAGLQSCAVVIGGSLSESLSVSGKDQEAASSLAGGGALGVLAAFLWLVGGALVIGYPKASVWIFSGSTLCWLIAGSTGFTDAWIWMPVAVVLALMSWGGVGERNRELSVRPHAHIATVMAMGAQAIPCRLPPSGWYPNPQGSGQSYWDGSRWTGQHRSVPELPMERAPLITNPLPPSGWYPNPQGSGQSYWDGSRWTGQDRSVRGVSD